MTAPAPTRPTPRPVAGASAPTPAGPPPSRRNLYLGVGAGVAVLAVAAVALALWRPWADPVPRLNDEPVKIARFAAGSDFTDLPFDKQRLYMDILRDKEDALEAAYDQRQLTDDEFRKALQVAWYDKELNRMEKFHKTPEAQRQAYLDEVIDKKKGKDKDDKAGKPKPANLGPLSAKDIDRDDSEEEAHVASWPDDVQQQWRQYRQALKDRKAQLKAEKEAKKAAAAAGGDEDTAQ